MVTKQKKRRKQTLDIRKTRELLVSLRFDEEVSLLLGNPTEIGQIALIDTSNGLPARPTELRVEQTYERAKGKKVIFQSSDFSAGIFACPNEQMASYGSVFAVDTNTDLDSGLSVSASIFVSRTIRSEAGAWTCHSAFQPSFIFESAGRDPERFAWHNLILRILQLSKLSMPVGVIVDSHLDDLPGINARKIAVNEDFFLPDGFTLLYASSDTGGEFIANAAIRQCDVLAKALIRNGCQLPSGRWFSYIQIDQLLVSSIFSAKCYSPPTR